MAAGAFFLLLPMPRDHQKKFSTVIGIALLLLLHATLSVHRYTELEPFKSNEDPAQGRIIMVSTREIFRVFFFK